MVRAIREVSDAALLFAIVAYTMALLLFFYGTDLGQLAKGTSGIFIDAREFAIEAMEEVL